MIVGHPVEECLPSHAYSTARTLCPAMNDCNKYPTPDQESQRPQRQSSGTVASKCGHAILILMLATVAIFALFGQIHSCSGKEIPGHSKPPLSICGDNSRTALRNDCSFDPIAFAWLPPACVDEQFLFDYLGQHNWTWYRHGKTTRPEHPNVLPRDEVITGRYDSVFVDQHFFELSCTYLERKRERLASGIEGVPDVLSRERHNACMLAEHPEVSGGMVTLEVQYPACPGGDGEVWPRPS